MNKNGNGCGRKVKVVVKGEGEQARLKVNNFIQRVPSYMLPVALAKSLDQMHCQGIIEVCQFSDGAISARCSFVTLLRITNYTHSRTL